MLSYVIVKSASKEEHPV